MAKRTKRRPEDDRVAVQGLFTVLASADPETVRAVLRDNPALADAVLGSAELQRLLQSLEVERSAEVFESASRPLAEPGGILPHAVPDEAPPGLFTELTRELSPAKAEQLYRKVVPLVVYELLRTLDQNTNVGTVQRVVEHLCSRDVQARLRQCVHVRDGMLDELAAVLRDHGLRAAIDRAGVQAIMEECGVTGELMALVNCIRLTQAAG